jgi:hypothetical protein
MQIPLGAREFRLTAPRAAGGAYAPTTVLRLQVEVGAGSSTHYEYAAADVSDWCALPGEVTRAQLRSPAFATIQYR